MPRNTTCNAALALNSKPPTTTLRYNTTQQLLTRIPERNHFCCTIMSSFAQVSARSHDDKQLNAQLQIIDEDVEKMNFNLISVENSIRRMSAARRKTSSESYLSVLAKQAKSRNALKTVASKLLSSQKIQQEKPIRFWNKRIWEQESKKINEVAATEQLSEKTTALLIESRKKMLAKNFQLFRLSSELKNMNLESVIMCIVLSPNLSSTETQFQVVKEITNADIKSMHIAQKKKAAANGWKKDAGPNKRQGHDRTSSNSPVKLAWAVSSLQKSDSNAETDNTFITARSAAMLSGPSLKESFIDPIGKKSAISEMSRNYSILTDRSIPSRGLTPEVELITDSAKGSKTFILHKWQLLRIMDEPKL